MNAYDHTPRHFDVVDAKNRGPAQYSRHNACCSRRIPIKRIRYPENVPNDALARNRQQDRTPELMEFFKFAVDTQVVRDLLGKIDSRVKNDGVARNA